MSPKAFIAAAATRPFEWGVNDCCLFPADWVRLTTGRDPAGAWRGAYRSPRQCWHFVRRAGGMERLCRESMAGLAGIAPEIDPAEALDGDVGVVDGTFEVAGGQAWKVLAAAVCVGGVWVVRSHRSLIGTRAPFVTVRAAWRIAPCPS